MVEHFSFDLWIDYSVWMTGGFGGRSWFVFQWVWFMLGRTIAEVLIWFCQGALLVIYFCIGV